MQAIDDLVQAIKRANSDQYQLALTGSGSKTQWLGSASEQGQMLSMLDYAGVVDYQPTELVVTVRAGTSLKDLGFVLAQEGQELAADPPMLAGGGTVGGAVAAGFSGPSRPWLGALRDAVLGIKMINGHGEVLSFGGQVMKNVAGYDISRLMTGSCGTLGVILDVSLRVRPKPGHELTLCYESNADRGVELCRSAARHPFPTTGTFWADNVLYMRFSGSEAGLNRVQEVLGGDVPATGDLWRTIRDHQHAFFKPRLGEATDKKRLFRIVTPPAAPIDSLDADSLAIEWAGGQRWLWHADAEFVHHYAQAVGGWAWQIGALLPAAQAGLVARIKQAFDPNELYVTQLDLGVARAN